MAARLRCKKPTTPEYKIAIVGGRDVGKSALLVRFKTRRYIGEYEHQIEKHYKHETSIDGETVVFDILDSCPKSDEEFVDVVEMLQWADGLLLVYSITDRNSFNYLRRAKSALQADIPMHLVASKSDMVHLRKVGFEEAESLANEIHSKFSELSAAEHYDQVVDVFNDLFREVHASKRKSKQSLLERVFSSARPYSRGKSDSNLGWKSYDPNKGKY